MGETGVYVARSGVKWLTMGSSGGRVGAGGNRSRVLALRQPSGHRWERAGRGAMFFGLHERQLDDKGRVALPATFRADLGDRCYLVIGDDRCIEVYSSEEFENRARDMIEAVRRGDETAERRRALAHSATLATIDKQGRVTVEEKLRDFARIPLVVQGLRRRQPRPRRALERGRLHRDLRSRRPRPVARGDS